MIPSYLIILIINFVIYLTASEAADNNERFERIAKEIGKIKEDLEERVSELEETVDKLSDLAKVGTLRSCAEYVRYGLNKDGLYMIDPDGTLIGEEPFQVFCNFTSGATEVLHDTDYLTEVEHCHDPGCFSKEIMYIDGEKQTPIPLTQIVSLIELAEYCTQEIHYDCTLAPLTDNDIDYAYWEDRHGETNVYFTGSNYGFHVCDCHFEEPNCVDEETEYNTCNFDANLPVPSSDKGIITNMTALPIMKLYFGGLSYDLQYAAFSLGPLKCFGDRPVATATSCSALKRSGVFQSGYYNIKGSEDYYASLVYCDMQSPTYTNVPQEAQPDQDSPIGTILSWVGKPTENIDVLSSIPDGWVLCNGSPISKGLWTGGKTPDLNGGHFLRGGSEEEILMFEEDQVLDHQHEDVGHIHGASSTASSHNHGYDDQYVQGTSGSPYQSGLHSGYILQYLHGQKNTDSATVSVSTTVSSHTSGIAGVSSTYKAGSENRPRNMRVQWIMRCW